jgi:hypothetical protein
VIYRVDAATRAERPGEKRVAVDINRRSAVSADWFRPSSSLKYFLVSTAGVARCQTSVIYVSDSSQGRAVGLKVEFEARCAEGREERVAEALCDDPNPAAVLTGKMKEWVHEHISQQPTTFLNEFFRAKVELESRLAARALAETGLDVGAEISLCGGEDLVRHIQLGMVALQVKLKDYGAPFDILFQAELTTGQEDTVNAVAYRADGVGMEELVRESALRYFVENVGLHDFYGRPDVIEAGLRAYLDEALKPVGRRLQSLALEYDRDIPSEPYEAQEEVEYRVPGYPESIIVRDSVQMTVQDYASYLGGGSPDLGDWLTENLNQVVQRTLCGKTYGDILLELEPAAREIKNKMSFLAASVGCGLQQQLTITNRSLEAWFEGFDIAAEDTFETALEGFHVRLRIAAAVMLRQLEDVKHYVARGTDIPKLMEKRSLDEVRRSLLMIHPERLYARPALLGEDCEEPVKALLSRQIRETLAEEFKAEVISVSVEMADTEFTKLLNDLRCETVSFEAEIFSHSPRSRGPFVFYGDCQIEDISREGWGKVWSAGLDINKIQGQLVNALKSGMETRADGDLAYLSGEVAEKVKGEIAGLITDYALREFGLHVRVSNVRRRATDVEKKMREAELANELLRIEMIRKLEQDMIRLIANGGRGEEIAQMQKSITTLKSYCAINAVLPDDGGRQSQPVEPGGRPAAPTLVNDHDVPESDYRTTGRVVGN